MYCEIKIDDGDQELAGKHRGEALRWDANYTYLTKMGCPQLSKTYTSILFFQRLCFPNTFKDTISQNSHWGTGVKND